MLSALLLSLVLTFCSINQLQQAALPTQWHFFFCDSK
jgi:hypothetical protein